MIIIKLWLLYCLLISISAKNWNCYSFATRKVLIIIEVDVVTPGEKVGDRIGTPVAYKAGDKRPVEAGQFIVYKLDNSGGKILL